MSDYREDKNGVLRIHIFWKLTVDLACACMNSMHEIDEKESTRTTMPARLLARVQRTGDDDENKRNFLGRTEKLV